MKSILLTFDLEEFDLPREQKVHIGEEEMYKTSIQGLTNLLFILNKHNIQATFFTTANFANKYPETLKQLSKNHEIASHGYSHSEPITPSNIKKAKEIKEEIINKKIKGFRAPRWNIKDTNIVNQADFEYDSSSHPIYLPGRYNNLRQTRYPHMKNNLIELPASTIRPNFSLFWLAFKNLPLYYAKNFTKLNFLKSKYTMMIQHPWEFADLRNINIPNHIKKPSGKQLTRKLDCYIRFCKKNNYKFQTCEQFLKKHLIKQYLKPINYAI
ncbi:MAG TPA: polysaccharide deacetylase family protein [Candidatus Pacearchaeota archaeon]|jgi:peptidoglycan/xylan/chitin deacetylase (PgdA/CDA1 family)|nr:polysaccharide deacetylase family protein [Candidatus Pacearchaeota archaeon]|tara:strand:+ start:279 stop:1085 length:807 start_codon:yes stop_codon:yes gene_type:complete